MNQAIRLPEQPDDADPDPRSAEQIIQDWPTLAVLRRRYLDTMIARAGGNKTRAAEMLGVDRRTIHRIQERERTKRRPPRKPAARPAPPPPPSGERLRVEDRVATGWPSLDEMSLRYVFEVLERAGHNKFKAARMLGINSWTMRRILKRAQGGRTPSMHTRI
jgi:DNA-binding protein Fis